MVEPRGIEPLSESNLERTSPGAVCYLHSLIRAGANTLPDESSFIMHGMRKALHTHGLHLNHTLARLVDLPGRMGA